MVLMILMVLMIDTVTRSKGKKYQLSAITINIETEVKTEVVSHLAQKVDIWIISKVLETEDLDILIDTVSF